MIDPYYIYVTLHLMECLDETLTYEPLDMRWDTALEAYQKFLGSEYNVGTKSEYDCIEDFLTNENL